MNYKELFVIVFQEYIIYQYQFLQEHPLLSFNVSNFPPALQGCASVAGTFPLSQYPSITFLTYSTTIFVSVAHFLVKTSFPALCFFCHCVFDIPLQRFFYFIFLKIFLNI